MTRRVLFIRLLITGVMQCTLRRGTATAARSSRRRRIELKLVPTDERQTGSPRGCSATNSGWIASVKLSLTNVIELLKVVC
ncbi:hypothetical protein EDD16DRAFT_1563079 [Pisolithus croceorrhizus]|nr:hypothetical protein EDD16DRAFT_1563079 [Pisolithus croceorrhizus]